MGTQAAEAHLLRYVDSRALSMLQPWSKANVPSGKILKDEETVGSYNIEEKGYVVCMVNKVCHFRYLCETENC